MNLNYENIATLRDFFRKLPEDNFSHSTWLRESWLLLHDVDPDEELFVKDANVCGTSACIGGWACIVGKLAPYRVEKNGYVWFISGEADCDGEELEADIDFGTLAAEWLGLEGWAEMAPVFWPFEIIGDYLDRDEALEGYQELVEMHRAGYLRSDTTAQEAADFLDLMIQRKGVDARWWKEVKQARRAAK